MVHVIKIGKNDGANPNMDWASSIDDFWIVLTFFYLVDLDDGSKGILHGSVLEGISERIHLVVVYIDITVNGIKIVRNKVINGKVN